ncbi:unnamed protein product, partial [Darwinula stevensoni]
GLLGNAGNAWAQSIRLDVNGVGNTQIPIAIPSFINEEGTGVAVSQIIMADLERSGQLRRVDASGINMNENSKPDFTLWRQKIADALAAGSVAPSTSGGWDVHFSLWDVVRGNTLLQQTVSVAQGDLRLAAHRVADLIYEKLTGQKGIFTSRLAYITKSKGSYQLWITDSDGDGAQVALTSREPIISPTWSPRGDELAYVSFETGKPVVYIHEVANGKRRVIANFKGSNSAPAWAPDGQSLVVSLSRAGGTQLFRVSRTGGAAQQLTHSTSINTEASYSPDGAFIYFVSDRGGGPQIYRMSAAGGAAERITFSGSYNISPSISPDGRHMAYISREGGGFKLRVMDLSSGESRAITQTLEDERPSFAGNSRLIVYATRQAGAELLMNTTLDGSVKTRLMTRRGDIREPSWGHLNNKKSTAAADGSATGQDADSSSTSRGVAPVEARSSSVKQPSSNEERLVYFDYDSYIIKPEYTAVVAQNAAYLKADKTRKATLEGHADARGGREYNLALGQKRADAVRQALSLLGVGDEQLEAVSFGKEKPVALGMDEESHAQNRRVEIVYK